MSRNGEPESLAGPDLMTLTLTPTLDISDFDAGEDGDDADAAGQRRRVGDDDVAGRGDVVPARRGDAHHQPDDRPAGPLLEAQDLVVDDVARRDLAARRVEAEDDRLDLRIAGGPLEPLEDAGDDALLAGEEARLEGRRDRPVDVDHQDLVLGPAVDEDHLLELVLAQEVDADLRGAGGQGRGQDGPEDKGSFHVHAFLKHLAARRVGGMTIRMACGRTRNSMRSRSPRNSPLNWMGRSRPLMTTLRALKWRSRR